MVIIRELNIHTFIYRKPDSHKGNVRVNAFWIMHAVIIHIYSPHHYYSIGDKI